MSGPSPEPDPLRKVLPAGISQLEILSAVSAFLTSERDYRAVVPDVFEMLLKNLGCHSICLFLAAREEQGRVLDLEFFESLRNITVTGYRIVIGEGLTGRVAQSRSSLFSPALDAAALDGEERFNPHLPGKAIAAFPVFHEDTVRGVLEFIFEPDDALPPGDLLASIANVFTNYLILVQSRQQAQRTQKKFSLLSSLRRVFAGTLELRPVLSVFMDLTASALSAEVGIFVLFREGVETPELEVNWGLSHADLLSLNDTRGESLFRKLLDHPGIVRLHHLDPAGFSLGGKRRGKVLHCLLGGTLRSKREPIGILLFANRTGRDREPAAGGFDEQDEELFSIMLDQARGMVENYLLYNKTVSMKNFNDNILESIDSGILSVDTDGVVLSANKRVAAITGIRDVLVGRRIENVFPLPLFDRQVFCEMVRDGKFPESAGEYQYRRGSRLRILSFVITSLKEEGGRSIGAVIAVFDMTEKRQMEEQVRRAESLAALGELSAGLAHEIKNPLTAIKGFAQLLPARLADGEFLLKFSEVITGQVGRLDDITERLLTFARPNLGEFSPVPVRELVNDTLALVRYQLEEAGIAPVLEANEGEDLRVLGNANRLSQVLLNIIINALHAMKQGGALVLKIGTAEQVLAGAARQAVVRIDCIDSGEGIPRDALRKVFNPFFTTKQSGTGLGLSISYRIIEEHGGTVEIRSRPGKGTRVRIVLPRAR